MNRQSLLQNPVAAVSDRRNRWQIRSAVGDRRYRNRVLQAPRQLYRFFPLVTVLLLVAGAARAGEETGTFWIARCKGFYGEIASSVLNDKDRRLAIADGTKENNVALAAYLKFVETWNLEHKRFRDANGNPVRKPADSNRNIELQKPGRKTLTFAGPYPTREAAVAELAPPGGGAENTTTNAADAAAPVLAPGKGGTWDYQYSLFLAEVEKLKNTPAASSSMYMGDDPRVKKMGGGSRSLTDSKSLAAPPPSATSAPKH